MRMISGSPSAERTSSWPLTPDPNSWPLRGRPTPPLRPAWWPLSRPQVQLRTKWGGEQLLFLWRRREKTDERMTSWRVCCSAVQGGKRRRGRGKVKGSLDPDWSHFVSLNESFINKPNILSTIFNSNAQVLYEYFYFLPLYTSTANIFYSTTWLKIKFQPAYWSSIVSIQILYLKRKSRNTLQVKVLH